MTTAIILCETEDDPTPSCIADARCRQQIHRLDVFIRLKCINLFWMHLMCDGGGEKEWIWIPIYVQMTRFGGHWPIINSCQILIRHLFIYIFIYDSWEWMKKFEKKNSIRKMIKIGSLTIYQSKRCQTAIILRRRETMRQIQMLRYFSFLSNGNWHAAFSA